MSHCLRGDAPDGFVRTLPRRAARWFHSRGTALAPDVPLAAPLATPWVRSPDPTVASFTI